MAQSPGKASSDRSDETTEAAKTLAEAVTDAAESVQEGGQEILRRVSRPVLAAGEVVRERAGAARDALAESGDRLNARLRKAASKAESYARDLPSHVSEASEAVSDAASDAAARLKGSAVGEIAADLRHMAKRHPGVFMAGAALAGFALARLMASRGDRDD